MRVLDNLLQTCSKENVQVAMVEQLNRKSPLNSYLWLLKKTFLTFEAFLSYWVIYSTFFETTIVSFKLNYCCLYQIFLMPGVCHIHFARLPFLCERRVCACILFILEGKQHSYTSLSLEGPCG